MKDDMELPTEEFQPSLNPEENVADKANELDELNSKIAELSKRGYQLLKENDIPGAKEAFSKALGTGITGFSLKDVWIENDKSGKPEFCFGSSAESLLREKCGTCKVFVSLSHEKEYAVAFVVIEV